MIMPGVDIGRGLGGSRQKTEGAGGSLNRRDREAYPSVVEGLSSSSVFSIVTTVFGGAGQYS
jgi:hypothetical protein